MNILRELLTEVKLMDPQFDDWLYRHVENEKIYNAAIRVANEKIVYIPRSTNSANGVGLRISNWKIVSKDDTILRLRNLERNIGCKLQNFKKIEIVNSDLDDCKFPISGPTVIFIKNTDIRSWDGIETLKTAGAKKIEFNQCNLPMTSWSKLLKVSDILDIGITGCVTTSQTNILPLSAEMEKVFDLMLDAIDKKGNVKLTFHSSLIDNDLESWF
jgi:hypothetical protein